MEIESLAAPPVLSPAAAPQLLVAYVFLDAGPEQAGRAIADAPFPATS